MNRARATVAAATLLLTGIGPAVAIDNVKQGETLLIRDCGRCHAVGRAGNSARPDAPPFRTLSRRYPIESLEEALGEGIMSGHPATRICRNSHLTPTMLVPSLPI